MDFRGIKIVKCSYFVLSQLVPEYPGGQVQKYPVDPSTPHDP